MAKLKIEPVENPDRIIQYWKKEKVVVFLIVIFGLSFNGLSVLSPIFQGKLIDGLVNDKSLKEIIFLVITFVLLIAFIQLLRYFKRFYIRRFANNTIANMRFAIYNTILHRNYPDLKKESIGNLMTRAVSDVDLCVEGMRKFTTEIFDTGVLMLAYYIALLVYDVKITLLSTIFIPVAMLVAEKLKTVIYRVVTDYRNKSSEIAQITVDAVENAMLYKVNGMEKQNEEDYETELSDLQQKAVKANLLENSMQPIYNVIAMAGVIFVLYFGGEKVLSGGWSIGEFSAYLVMFISIAIKASKASKLFNSVQKSKVSWQRIKPYLANFKTKDDKVTFNTDKTILNVKNLEFTYDESKDPILKDVNFEGKQGEMIGITGTIASGKSTLGMSLLGLYPFHGSITIDGKNLFDYSEYERSSMISYLGHQPLLLTDTIYNNITLGEAKDITEVLKTVCFDTDLQSMPDGQNTLVGNTGVRLSGGQQARVALARTLLEKRKIIILDDPFSAVDQKTEEEILSNLRRNYRESLIILISHRLTAFPAMDKVLLLNKDKSMVTGTHDELMQENKLYATIFNMQTKQRPS